MRASTPNAGLKTQNAQIPHINKTCRALFHSNDMCSVLGVFNNIENGIRMTFQCFSTGLFCKLCV